VSARDCRVLVSYPNLVRLKFSNSGIATLVAEELIVFLRVLYGTRLEIFAVLLLPCHEVLYFLGWKEKGHGNMNGDRRGHRIGSRVKVGVSIVPLGGKVVERGYLIV